MTDGGRFGACQTRVASAATDSAPNRRRQGCWPVGYGRTPVSNPEVLDRPDVAPTDGDHERFAHIIRKSDEMKGYVLGEEVTALCGKKWVPSRDPQRFPSARRVARCWQRPLTGRR